LCRRSGNIKAAVEYTNTTLVGNDRGGFAQSGEAGHFAKQNVGEPQQWGKLLVRCAALTKVRKERKIPKAAENLQGSAAFVRLQYTERGKTPHN